MTDEPLHRAQAELLAAAVAYAEAHARLLDRASNVNFRACGAAEASLHNAGLAYARARREAGL